MAWMARTGLWKGVSCYMHISKEVPTPKLSQGHAAESRGKEFRQLAQNTKRCGTPGHPRSVPRHLNQKSYPGPANTDSRAPHLGNGKSDRAGPGTGIFTSSPGDP